MQSNNWERMKMGRWWSPKSWPWSGVRKRYSVREQIVQLRTQLTDLHRERQLAATHQSDALNACLVAVEARTAALCELIDSQRIQNAALADRQEANITEAVRSTVRDSVAAIAEFFPMRGELGFDDPRSSTSLFRQRCLLAQQETIEILDSSMPNAVCEYDHRAFLLKAVAASQSDGHLLEFGVWNGTTLRWMAEAYPDRRFMGFDSFTGLPAEWSGYKTFNFDRQGLAPTMPSNVELVIGPFDETLTSALQTIDEIAFLHIDCDLYASAKYVLDNVIEKMGRGSIIVFDEYFNYPGFRHHEYKACAEAIQKQGINIEWLYYSGERVAGRLIK